MADFIGGVGAWAEETADQAQKDIAGAPEWAPHVGGEVISGLEQSVEVVRGELSKIDVDVVNGWLHGAAAFVQEGIDAMGGEERSGFEKWLKNVSNGIGMQALLDGLQAVKLEDLPGQTTQYIMENQWQTALIILGGLAFFASMLLCGPALSLAGVGPAGVGAGMSLNLFSASFTLHLYCASQRATYVEHYHGS